MRIDRSIWTGIALVMGAALLFLACDSDADGPVQSDAGLDAVVDATPDATPDAGPDPYEQVELAFQMEMLEFEAPGAAFAIVEGGEVTHTAAFGRRHPDHPEPTEPTTLFRIASVTKMFTAIALLQQVQDGALALDDPLDTAAPGFVLTQDATRSAEIVVEQLLTHTSGLNDYLSVDAEPGYEDATALHDFTYDGYAHEGWIMAPPGRLFNYTNPGYVLAGLAVELAAQTPYADTMRDDVFVPLGMTRTFFDPEIVLADGDFATGDISEPGWAAMVGSNRAHPTTYDNPWGWPAGYAYSSVLDLAQVIRFYRDGDPAVLADDLREAMWTPRINTHWKADLCYYGYGLTVWSGGFIEDDFYEVEIVHHNGALPGFSSELFWLPSCDVAFITLANTDLAYFHKPLRVVFEDLCGLSPSAAGPDIDANPADHPDYVGTYHEPMFLGDMIVTSEGGELRVEIPALAAWEYSSVLAPVGKDTYTLTVNGDFDVTFVRDGGDQAEYLRNRLFVGIRVPDGSPSPPPRSPTPLRDLDRLQRMVLPRPPSLASPRSRRRHRRRYSRR